ncbi:hypothetical protein AVEN_177520-1, partial [Araneus ventricosus]
MAYFLEHRNQNGSDDVFSVFPKISYHLWNILKDSIPKEKKVQNSLLDSKNALLQSENRGCVSLVH